MRNALSLPQLAAGWYALNQKATNALKDYIQENALFGAFSDTPKPQLSQEQMQEEVALRALDAVTPFPIAGITIGRKGLENLGVNAERDLVGQYSGLWDKGVRAELDDASKRMKYGNWAGAENVQRNHPLEVMGVKGFAPGHQSFGAYDNLGDVGVDLTSQQTGGSYRRATSIDPERIIIGDQNDNTLFHELQHAIQEREGFARGGSPEYFQTPRDTAMARVNFLNNELSRLAKEIDNATGEAKKALKKEYDDVMNEKFEVWDTATADPYEQYKRLAGEWEARNAGTRAVLPADDPRLGNALDFNGVTFRTGQPFSTADDIALQDFIIRMGE